MSDPQERSMMHESTCQAASVPHIGCVPFFLPNPTGP